VEHGSIRGTLLVVAGTEWRSAETVTNGEVAAQKIRREAVGNNAPAAPYGPAPQSHRGK